MIRGLIKYSVEDSFSNIKSILAMEEPGVVEGGDFNCVVNEGNLVQKPKKEFVRF
jgi:hypothetical protein